MNFVPAGLALLLPLTFGLGALGVPTHQPLTWASRVASVAAGLVGALGLSVALWGPATTLVRLDVVTGAMLSLVALLGVVVTRFSATALAGEPGLRRYARALLVALSAVTTLVVSQNLAVMAIAWMVTSLALHHLLTFYPDRRPALLAAHKKFIVSRLADVSFAAALALIGFESGTLRLDALEQHLATQTSLGWPLQLAALLVVAGVALKSAQLPFHGWLTQVMEAPTPVSALLHAGVVNLGGVFLIRLALLLSRSPAAMSALVAIGLTTAVLAGLVMMTRVSIKLSLAWSTCAQLGFMLVQCGLGAWDLALLHLVAHSLYKAYAFLSAGSTVETWKVRSQATRATPALGGPLLAVGLVGVGAAVACWLGAGAVVPLSLSWALAFAGLAGERGAVAGLLRVVAMLGLGIAWHLLAGALWPTPHLDGPLVTALSAVCTAGLVALAAAQVVLRARPDGALARALQPRLFAGFFLDEYFTRLTFRWWPPHLPPVTTPAPVVSAEAR